MSDVTDTWLPALSIANIAVVSVTMCVCAEMVAPPIGIGWLVVIITDIVAFRSDTGTEKVCVCIVPSPGTCISEQLFPFVPPAPSVPPVPPSLVLLLELQAEAAAAPPSSVNVRVTNSLRVIDLESIGSPPQPRKKRHPSLQGRCAFSGSGQGVGKVSPPTPEVSAAIFRDFRWSADSLIQVSASAWRFGRGAAEWGDGGSPVEKAAG